MKPALIVVAAALACSCNREQPAAKAASRPARMTVSPNGDVRVPPDSPQLSRIGVARVRTARVALDEVVAPGKIEAKPTRVAHVVMPVAGRVVKLLVAIGDAVRQGSPVMIIESPDVSTAASNYRQARARVEESKAGLAKSEADVARARDLYQNHAIAQKDVLSAEAALAQARSALAQSEASQDEALRRLQIFGLGPDARTEDVAVRAPVSGKVLDIAVTAGEYRNDTSAPLMTIADLSTVYMAADVPENQIRLIDPGEQVNIALAAYPGETFHGRVARIADTVDPQTRTIKVRAELSNPGGRLRPDMFGEIRHEENYRDVPVVPSGAVIQSDKQSIVYRERAPGDFQPVPVKFGKPLGDTVPVLEGLAAGDRVVVDGAMLLKGAS